MAKPRNIRRGNGSEGLVRNVLDRLKAKGTISDFCRAKPKNAPGYDFSIELPGRTVLLQVKSSIAARETHKQRYPDIPCVVVPRHPLAWTKWAGRKQAQEFLTNRILEILGVSFPSTK